VTFMPEEKEALLRAERREALLRAERRTALWFWDGDFEVRNNYDCDEKAHYLHS
jgi:hypothetical protein